MPTMYEVFVVGKRVVNSPAPIVAKIPPAIITGLGYPQRVTTYPDDTKDVIEANTEGKVRIADPKIEDPWTTWSHKGNCRKLI